MATTYNNLYLDIRQQLRRAGIEEATLEARELVCFGTNKSREELARDGGLYASPELEHRVRDLVRRHLEGEPVAYLIGEWEFYGLPLDISRDVLIPRPDTEILAERALQYLEAFSAPRVLDLCTGSGALAVTIAAQRPDARVVACDISEEALCVARENAAGLNISFARGDLFAAVEGAFDVIVCNPPYLTAEDMLSLQREVRYEPALALRGGADGLDFYRAISEKWRAALHPGSRLFFEVGIGQADDVLRIMRAQGFGDIEIVPDTAGIPRVVYGTLYDSVFDNGES